MEVRALRSVFRWGATLNALAISVTIFLTMMGSVTALCLAGVLAFGCNFGVCIGLMRRVRHHQVVDRVRVMARSGSVTMEETVERTHTEVRVSKR